MNIKRKIKRRILRWMIYFRNEYRKSHLKEKLISDNQKKAIIIIKSLCADKDSRLIFSNVSNRRYIEYKNHLVILNYDIVNIIDLDSCYDISMDKDEMIWLNEEFDKELERRVRSLELFKRKNLGNVLDKLIEHLNNDQLFKK